MTGRMATHLIEQFTGHLSATAFGGCLKARPSAPERHAFRRPHRNGGRSLLHDPRKEHGVRSSREKLTNDPHVVACG